MRVTFCGVRGSTPVAGPEFARVGGHTSCVAISVGDERPTLVLDAGTGLQPLAREFGDAPFRGTILLTHLHWDHVQGLPFFPPADRDDAEVLLGQPAQGDPVATLARAMSPPHFPIGPDGLRGNWKHVGIEPGTHEFDGYEVVAREVRHKGGRALGYRITRAGASVAYVPDAVDDNDDAIIDLARDVDLFVRGAPFLASESERANDVRPRHRRTRGGRVRPGPRPAARAHPPRTAPHRRCRRPHRGRGGRRRRARRHDHRSVTQEPIVIGSG